MHEPLQSPLQPTSASVEHGPMRSSNWQVTSSATCSVCFRSSGSWHGRSGYGDATHRIRVRALIAAVSGLPLVSYTTKTAGPIGVRKAAFDNMLLNIGVITNDLSASEAPDARRQVAKPSRLADSSPSLSAKTCGDSCGLWSATEAVSRAWNDNIPVYRVHTAVISTTLYPPNGIGRDRLATHSPIHTSFCYHSTSIILRAKRKFLGVLSWPRTNDGMHIFSDGKAMQRH
jgi:hypothetical protein